MTAREVPTTLHILAPLRLGARMTAKLLETMLPDRTGRRERAHLWLVFTPNLAGMDGN